MITVTAVFSPAIYTQVPQESAFYTVEMPARKSVGITGIYQPLTKKFFDSYSSDSGRMWLCNVLYESTDYRPYIRQQLKKHKMPLCLQYLPIVESDYKVKAVSPSGAKGIWQFMDNSMSPYMKKNWWYDERFDPWKETDAAIQKLKENHKTFKSWPLAIAAYNMGAGALKRILKEHPGKDFWYLAENGYIRKETADYVPKLIAIADMIENAEYWGFIDIAAADKICPEKVQTYDYIKITGSAKFESIAKASGLSIEEIRKLNPALLHDATPPSMTWKLRLPKGTAKSTLENLTK